MVFPATGMNSGLYPFPEREIVLSELRYFAEILQCFVQSMWSCLFLRVVSITGSELADYLLLHLVQCVMPVSAIQKALVHKFWFQMYPLKWKNAISVRPQISKMIKLRSVISYMELIIKLTGVYCVFVHSLCHFFFNALSEKFSANYPCSKWHSERT